MDLPEQCRKEREIIESDIRGGKSIDLSKYTHARVCMSCGKFLANAILNRPRKNLKDLRADDK
jgi:hypothetical protein